MPVNCDVPLTASLEAPAAIARTRPVSRKIAKSIPVHISGTTVPDCYCELAGIDSGVLFVRSERQIPESSPVAVSFTHTQLSGIVAGCQPAGPDWIVSIALAACKRRLEDRKPNGEESIIGVVESNGTSLHSCTIVDTSSFGLGLRLSFPIDTGARICVETESMMVFGEVRYCNPRPDGQFIAGVLIVDVVADARTQNKFSVMLNGLRWKLASSIRGRDVPAYRSFQ